MQAWFASLVFFFAAFSAPLAHAADLFYVELGSTTSQEDAANRWDELYKTHRKILGGLRHYPTVVYEGRRKISIRIQAGPLESKEDAQKLCAELFKKDAPCFVIEGMEAPEVVAKRRAEAKPKRVALPWQQEQAQPQPAPAAEEPGFFGRLFGDDSETVSPPPAIAASDLAPVGKDGKVEVAEAILVAKSDEPTGSRSVFIDSNSEQAAAAPAPAPEPQTAPAAQDAKIETIGWLNVDKFESEELASLFWQNVRGRSPALAAGLRVRIHKPLMLRAERNVTLNIGPFGSEADATRFCEEGIKPIDPTLRCRFAPGAQGSKPTLKPSRSRAEASPREPAAEAPMMAESRRYWVQVLSSPDQEDAAQQWASLKAEHPDLFASVKSRISASLGGLPGYMVRVGPYSSEAEASELCTSMQSRELECKLFSSR